MNKEFVKIVEVGPRDGLQNEANTVSIEDQMWRSAEASRDHNAATTIYSKALAMLRASVSGGQ